MARKGFGLVMLAVVLAFGMSLTSCATYTTRNSEGAMPLGLLTGINSVLDGRTVIAEYTIILGLITSGYEDFLRATEGREFDIVTRFWLFGSTVMAVERDARTGGGAE